MRKKPSGYREGRRMTTGDIVTSRSIAKIGDKTEKETGDSEDKGGKMMLRVRKTIGNY